MGEKAGTISRVIGPVVEIETQVSLRILDMVEVGTQRLVGEVVRLKDSRAYVQVYEDTTSLKAGDPVFSEGAPLSVELGPGLIGTIFDGIQRPLSVIREKEGSFIRRGLRVPALDPEKRWQFVPCVRQGSTVEAGAVIGEVKETKFLTHRVMVPPSISGEVVRVAPEGMYTVTEPVAVVRGSEGDQDIFLSQRWPVRKPRPYRRRFPVSSPLITGQRVIDTLFPIAKGGCVAVPGGFGTGKTVIEHQLAKWSDADVVVFVGCGERGNEMADVLHTFPQLTDPRTGGPLMERTIVIANTSNMPVAAREASIYTGITLAEYYRDMGLDVALMADSTSRWAEALRELSGRLEEMPLEEGFPAYLPARLAEFYERAGMVETLAGSSGSISVIASVSPPGGDFSEPVTTHTRRFVRGVWVLDRDLSYARHFPAISWTESYSEYVDEVRGWWEKNVDPDWLSMRYEMMDLLQREQKLQQVVKLVGPDVLPQSQRLVLDICEVFKNAFLQQSAFDPMDACTSARKQALMLRAMLALYREAERLVQQGTAVSDIKRLEVFAEVVRMRERYGENDLERLAALPERIRKECATLES